MSGAFAAEPRPVERKPVEIKLPTRIEAGCLKAKGEHAHLCAEFARLWTEREQMRVQAIEAKRREDEKFKQMTHGGIAQELE